MSAFFTVVALLLLGTAVAGLIRVHHGPTSADRMLAVQLMGTSSVAILLLLSEALAQPALRNVALVFVVLAILVVVTFVKGPVTQGKDQS